MRKGRDNQLTSRGGWGGGSLGGRLGALRCSLLLGGWPCLLLPGWLDASGPFCRVAAVTGASSNPLHRPGLPPTSQLPLLLPANLSHLHPSPEFCPWSKGDMDLEDESWRWTLANAYLSRVTPTTHTLTHPVLQSHRPYSSSTIGVEV